MNTLVSIIIPAYNSEKYLSQCLNSVIKQSYKDIEIIVINDGSTDGTRLICEKYKAKDARIVVINKNNGGISSARNTGVKNANGSYIMFLDSDDYLSSKCVEECVKLMMSQNVEMIKYSYWKTKYCFRKKYNYATQSKIAISKKDYRKMIYENIFYSYDFSNVWTMFIKADIARKIEFQNYKIGEDFLYAIQCLLSCKSIYILNKPLYFYRIHSSSVTHAYSKQHINDEIKALKKISTIIGYKGGLDKRVSECYGICKKDDMEK